MIFILALLPVALGFDCLCCWICCWYADNEFKVKNEPFDEVTEEFGGELLANQKPDGDPPNEVGHKDGESGAVRSMVLLLLVMITIPLPPALPNLVDRLLLLTLLILSAPP